MFCNRFNYYSELANSGIFRVLYLGKDCPTCVPLRIQCIHAILSFPRWKTEARQQKIISFIKDQALVDRELFGKINSGTQFVFNREWIQKLVARVPYKFVYPVQVLHTAVDPAGGANSSDFVIGTMAYENNMQVVTTTTYHCNS